MRRKPNLLPKKAKKLEQEEFPDDPSDTKQDSEGENLETGLEEEGEAKEDLLDMDFSDEFAALKEMEEDLREHYEREYEGEAKLGNSDAAEKRKFFFDSLVAETSLQEHLLDQLKLVVITEGPAASMRIHDRQLG